MSPTDYTKRIAKGSFLNRMETIKEETSER